MRYGKEVEVEDGWDPTRIPAKCWACSQKHTVMVRLTDQFRYKTTNRLGVCTNPACPRFTHIEQLTTWAKE